MRNDDNQAPNPQSLLDDWIKTTQAIWASLGPTAPSGDQPPSGAPKDEDKKPDRLQELWSSNLKVWQTLFSQGFSSEGAGSMIKGVHLMPELATKLMQISMQGVSQLQSQWTERLRHLHGDDSDPYKFKDLDKAFLDRWTSWYEKEVQQFFNIPQLGLTRLYQEDINQATDKFNQFQGALIEFLHMLYLPVEKSIKVMQDELTTMAQQEPLPEDSKFYYNKWVRTLEGHYMTLFQSAEYMQCLAKTIDSLNNYVSARQSVLEDALKVLPVPTNTDLDELSKEIYELKRRVRTLEKRLSSRS